MIQVQNYNFDEYAMEVFEMQPFPLVLVLPSFYFKDITSDYFETLQDESTR